MRQFLIITFGAIFAVSAIVIGFTYTQVSDERLTLAADLQYRTRLLSDSLKESVEPNFARNSTTTLQRIVDRFTDRERIVGLAVFNNRGIPLAASKEISRRVVDNPDFVFSALDNGEPAGVFETLDGSARYLFVSPLFDGPAIVGALVTVQDASYIDAAIDEIWRRNFVRLLIYIVVFSAAIVALIRFALLAIMRRFADTVKSARMERTGNLPVRGPFFLRPVANEIAKMHTSLAQARFAASEEARMRLEKLDSPWTAERLKQFVKAYLKDRKLYVISNQEPYIHQKTRRGVVCSVVPSGLNTAVNSVMEACDGVWIAHGSGDADRETADDSGKLRVPPQDPHYTLKRVWLSEKESKGHYSFSVEALYPLFLMTYTRPIFKKEDWLVYEQVNRKYADTVCEEIKNAEQPIVLIQDYHFALLPKMIKESRPDAQVAIFWHVPWPSPEAFSVCPWRKDVILGMLGADIVGFNTQQFCNNFIDTVGKEVESLIDLETFSVTREDHVTQVKSLPISIAFTEGPDTKPELPETEERGASRLRRLGIRTKYLGIGVDRLDHAKGIPERLRGVEAFFDAHPEYIGQLTFLQIASPHREHFKEYQEQYRDVIAAETERINKRLGSNDWKPIVLEASQYSHAELRELFRSADFCLITSLHDSMNLVAKEYAAARSDLRGVLILSQFAGASRDLKEALIVNPHSTEEIGEAVHTAVKMPAAAQRRRMSSLRASVRDYNVYRWAAEFIKAVTSLS